MSKEHFYNLTLKWTGNNGEGTAGYRSYERSYSVLIDGKQDILGSSDPAFRGDKAKHNPEELLLASLSSCHMLWFLHLCSDNGIIVADYTDNPVGTMEETPNGSGKFTEVVLNPVVTIVKGSTDRLAELHHEANKLCFIANSVNFPVKHNSVWRLSE